MNLKSEKNIYKSPRIEFWTIESKQCILKSLSVELYLEGDIDGYDYIGEF